MSYRLKINAPEFTAISGSLAGCIFRHGVDYENVPESDQSRFEKGLDVPAVNGRKRIKEQPAERTVAKTVKFDKEIGA